MAEPITVQKLIEASMDSDSLEILVNGDENAQVTTRLGETYPSAKKAIKTMFDNGGLPATPFATKALMTASALVDGDYAQVTDDTVNNGLYLKTEGSWVKSDYDPLTLSKTHTNAAVSNLADPASERYYGQSAFNRVGAVDRYGNIFTDGFGTWRMSEYVPVKAGDNVHATISAETTSKRPAIAFYNNNQDFVDYVEIPAPTQGYKTFYGVAPVDGFVVAQHASTGFEFSNIYINQSLVLSDEKLKRTQTIQNKADALKKTQYLDFESGYVDIDGNPTVDDKYLRSQVYKLKAETEINIDRLHEFYWIGYAFSDTPTVGQTELVHQWLKNTGYKISVPADRPYIRFYIRHRTEGIAVDLAASSLYDIYSIDTVVYKSDITSLQALASGDLASSKKRAITKGSYSWWCEPLSLSITGMHPKTFVGGVDIQSGWHTASEIDTSKVPALVSNLYLQSGDVYVPDEHNVPISIVARDKLVTFYVGHNDVSYLPYRCSSTLSTDDLGSEVRIASGHGGVSYTQAYYNHADDTLYVAFRAGGSLGVVNHWYLASSTDWDSVNPTWTVSDIFKDTEQMYLRLVPTYDGLSFRCLVTKNARYNAINGLWFAQINLVNSEITTGNNVVVGAVGSGSVQFSQLTKIYTATDKIRLYDAKTELNKLPILVGVFDNQTSGGFYRYLEYDLTTFTITKDVPIVQSGASLGGYFYFGGAHFCNVTAMGNGLPQSDSYSPVYIARESAGTWYVEEYKTVDNGATWTLAQEIDKSSKYKLWRPRVPFNRDVIQSTPNQIELTWCKGTWSSFLNYDASIWALKK